MTILSSVIPSSVVADWKKRGLKISPRIVKNPNAIRSPGPDWWVYGLDEFCSGMSAEEVEKYYAEPQAFVDDFLASLKVYTPFLQYLESTAAGLIGAATAEQAAALAHLFQSTMCDDYYKFDRQLEYTDSEASPVGRHWLGLGKRIRELKPELDELDAKALHLDLVSGKIELNDEDVKKHLAAIKLFEYIGEEEGKQVMTEKGFVAINCGTAILKLVRVASNLTAKFKSLFSDDELQTLVVDTLRLTSEPEKYLTKKQLKAYREEIKRWL